MRGMMFGSDSDFNFEDMNQMHNLMCSQDDISQEEFEWLIEEQKEHMGLSWIENSLKNAQEFNESKNNNQNFNGFMRGMMGGAFRGRGMMRQGGCPMWR